MVITRQIGELYKVSLDLFYIFHTSYIIQPITKFVIYTGIGIF